MSMTSMLSAAASKISSVVLKNHWLLIGCGRALSVLQVTICAQIEWFPIVLCAVLCFSSDLLHLILIWTVVHVSAWFAVVNVILACVEWQAYDRLFCKLLLTSYSHNCFIWCYLTFVDAFILLLLCRPLCPIAVILSQDASYPTEFAVRYSVQLLMMMVMMNQRSHCSPTHTV